MRLFFVIKVFAMDILFISLIGAFIIVLGFCGSAAKDVLGSK